MSEYNGMFKSMIKDYSFFLEFYFILIRLYVQLKYYT